LEAILRPQLTIAIDFDNTFTADVEAWSAVIRELQRHGHQVICVSARHNDVGHRQELTTALPKGVPVLLSMSEPKRQYATRQGFAVDIWIDDIPEAIPTKDEFVHYG
jgi:hypothetical protein